MLRSMDETQRRQEVIAHLTQLASLREVGVLSQEEFEAAKARLLGDEAHLTLRFHWVRNTLVLLLVLVVAASGLAAAARDRHWWRFARQSHTFSGLVNVGGNGAFGWTPTTTEIQMAPTMKMAVAVQVRHPSRP